MRSELESEPAEQVLTTVVTPKTQVDPAAPSIAGEVRMIAPDAIRGVAERAFEALREARAAARGLSEDELADRIATE